MEALIRALVEAGQLEEPAGDAARHPPGQDRAVCQDLHGLFEGVLGDVHNHDAQPQPEELDGGTCSDCRAHGLLGCPTHSQSGFYGGSNENNSWRTAAPGSGSFRSGCEGMGCAGSCCSSESCGACHTRAADPPPVESQARSDGGSGAQSAETPLSGNGSAEGAGAEMRRPDWQRVLDGMEPESGGPSRQLPLEDYAYYHSSPVYNSLMQLEHGLSHCSRKYREALAAEGRHLGWLRTQDYCFSGARRLERNDTRATKSHSRASVPVRVPFGLPRIKKSSSSGEVSAWTIQYRRLLTAEIRGLYLQLIVRQHYTEEAAAEAVAGGKRKSCESSNTEASRSSKEMEARRMMAAASAFISDVPLVMLKLLVKDLNDRNMAIVSEKKLRKKILKEIKQEARLTRQDPMTVLEAAVKTAGSSGSMRQFGVLSGLLNKSSPIGNTLPTAEQIARCKRELMELAVVDLELQPTPDGYRTSLIRTVETEALRLMQMINTSKNKEVRAVGQTPDLLNWQDHYHVKLTFDARRITKHCSQTEVMIIFLPKGQKGVERCQQAVHIRTVAVWSGKDSKENVVRNMRDIITEIAELEKNGIAFCRGADSFDKVVESEQYKEWLGAREPEAAYKSLPNTERPGFGEWLRTSDTLEPVPFRRVGISFWIAADMLAQCSLLGQGCAGHFYCAHCEAHKENRHLPFELVKVEKPTNFFKLANDNDTKVEALWAINTCEDLGTGERPPWKLTEEGLRGCTLPCTDPALARVVAAPPNALAGSPPAVQAAAPPPPVASAPMPGMRQEKGKKKGTGAAAVAPAPPQAMHHRSSTEGAPLPVQSFPEGPCVGVIKRCCGWKQGHAETCQCQQCMIPAGTIVRRMIQPGFNRESEFLNANWRGVRRGRFPFCALHCCMRITEAMFYNICQNALAAGDPAVARLNAGMELIGLKSKKFQKVKMFNCDNFERLSFLGTEALHLLKKPDGRRRNIQVLLEHLWPSGDASESPEGLNFVMRSIVLWESWAEAVELMSQRDPAKLRESMDGRHGDGFARFGKVCREFVFRYQVMFHKTHCKSFYLHTLLAHAGDFMRELERHNMCLGMMSNSGAERRHEYGRRAFRRSL